MHKFSYNKGVTLIELVVAIPIFIIVLTIAFSINNFGNKISKKSLNQSYNQQDVRLIADYITREVRSANIINTDPKYVKPTSNNYYALIFKNNHLVKQSFVGTSAPIETIIGNSITSLVFLTSTKGSLKVSVIDNNNGQNYNINFNFLLDNSITPTIVTSTDPPIIYYAKNQ